MPNNQTIVGLELLPNGKFQCKDWRGRAVEVEPDQLAAHCTELLNDPELPRVEVLTPGHATVVEAATRLLIPEHLREVSGPLVQLCEILWKQATAAPARPQPPPQPGPTRPSADQKPPSGERAGAKRRAPSRGSFAVALRRGRMVG